MKDRKYGFLTLLMKQVKKNYFYYLLVIPGLIWLIMFCYMPMVGIYMAFTDYTYKGGIFGSEYIGLRNFKIFFSNMDVVWRAVRNTLIINFGTIFLGLVVNVSVAIMLNEVINQRFRKTVQSLILFPHFLSWIVIGAISKSLFARDNGILNKLIELFGRKGISWYTSPQFWWVILIVAAVWKGFGYGSIVYYATITGFDPCLYEAARVDGASRWKMATTITLPLLRPTMVLLFLLSVGSILGSSLDFIMGMTKLLGKLLPTTDTVTTLIYRMTMQEAKYGNSAAASLLQSVVGCVFVLTANIIAKKIDPDYALF